MNNINKLESNFLFHPVNFQGIGYPDRFISSLYEGAADLSLIASLQNFGQIQPLLVWQKNAHQYELLSGYASFAALLSLGIEQILCQILPHSTTPYFRYALQILHGLAVSQSSPILQAHLLLQAQKVLSDEQLLSLLPLMGYKPQRHKLKELTALLLLEPSAVMALHRGILSPKSGKLFARLAPQDHQTLVELIAHYRPGGSKQQKLVEMVTELSLREKKPVGEILQEWLPAGQESVQENIPQRLQGLLQALDERLRPNKVEAEKTFKRFVQELQPPAGVTIEHSLSFEDESMEVRLRFADSASLWKRWEHLKTLMQTH